MKFNAAINSGAESRENCARHAPVHACTREFPPLRDAFTSGAAARQGGSHIVLVLIYAAHRAFLLPRYRDLSAANYTFTPFLVSARSLAYPRAAVNIRRGERILARPPEDQRGRVRVPPSTPFLLVASFFRAVAGYT